ncbi:mRNA transport regulator MTR10 [Nakaseomyces bracarensis]|uniref:mRNA transport regulator MTR10 n=1 Tax=Nakaseomyces bracarensis TaxID=273131 RepID=A0ABR4NWR5_9SACH
MATVEEIVAALQCISSNAAQEEKNKALGYLEGFQRSADAWILCHDILNAADQTSLELLIFAAQTLRNKVTYDLVQLGDNLPAFKDSLLKDLTRHQNKLVLTQINVALARLAIQFLEWRDPIQEIITILRPYPAVLLGFLQVLPEETLNIGSIPLTEDEFNSRIHELIDSIAQDVLQFLIQCTDNIKSGDTQLSLENILKCISSWSFEFSVDQLLSVQPLVNLIFETLMNGSEDSGDIFEAAVDCLCVILKESRDASNEQLIMALYEQLIQLQQKLLPTLESAQLDDDSLDPDLMEGMTRLFVEAGEAWSVSISKSPEVFRPLVKVLLLLACKNSDLDVVSYTFQFWFNLRQNLVLPRFQKSKEAYADIYIDLINGVIIQLKYPDEQFSNKEEADKFKEFRYHMGDVLKDCTAVVGTSKALTQPLNVLTNAISNNNSWQYLEAPLFSLRTMAQEISLTENKLLPQIIDIMCSLPEHPKIRYASTLVLGRYTEWTSKHPETLEKQIQYIFDGFNQAPAGDTEIIPASAHALMYFCSDCADLLSTYIEQLIDFYFNIQGSVDIESQFELCQGLSAVLNKQSNGVVSPLFQRLIEQNFSKLNILVPKWKQNQAGSSGLIADQIDLLFALFEELKPRFHYPNQGSDPLLPQIEYIWTSIRSLLIDQSALADEAIAERSTKLLRKIFENYHIFCESILPSVAEVLVQGYSLTGFGSYLWCSGSIIVIFGDDESFPVSPELKESVWNFACSQCETFMINFKKIHTDNIKNHPDLVMDFFSMISDLLMFYPQNFIFSPVLLKNVLEVAEICLTKIVQYDTYILIIRFIDDVLSWGFKTPPISTAAIETVPDEWRQIIFEVAIREHGASLINSFFTGLIYTFDSSAHSDAITVIVRCCRLAYEGHNGNASVIMQWLDQTCSALGNVDKKAKENLISGVVNGITRRDFRKVREDIRNFVDWYLRKNINSRLD